MSNLFGLDELRNRVLEKDNCAACGACAAGCPYVTAFRGKTVVLDSCTVKKGRCFTYCPMTFFNPEPVTQMLFTEGAAVDELGHWREVTASRAAEEDIATKGQGGGSVTAMVVMALETGLLDSVVLTGQKAKDNYPGPILATSVEDVMSCVGSKYVGAHSLIGLREALDRGFQRIGVVGLPCQVRSVRKMALYDLKQENIKHRVKFVWGLFCNWAFSSRDFTRFLIERLGYPEVNKLHIPPPPANCLEIETNEGVTSISLDELRPMIQAACGSCPDMTAEFADLSIGMYEGRPKWNTTIIRTTAGEDLFRMALERRVLITEPFPDSNREHLAAASMNKRQRGSKSNGNSHLFIKEEN